MQCSLKDNIARLPSTDAVKKVSIPALHWQILNIPGKKASVSVFNHLATKYNGKLTASAAEEGLQLYDEYVEEAKAQPGSHPNIDLLFRVIAEGLALEILVEH